MDEKLESRKRARGNSENDCDDERKRSRTRVEPDQAASQSTTTRYQSSKEPPGRPVWELQSEGLALVSENGHFRYSYLANPEKQIRLLKFTNNARSGPLAIETSIWNRESAPEYIAISCTRGERSFDTINVDGFEVFIRRGCRYALQQVRVYVWIDVICIDQTRLDEKVFKSRKCLTRMAEP